MDKYTLTCYQKTNSMWMVNGGKLLITENEYIIKYYFHTVAHFEIDKTLISKIPNLLYYSGLRFNDGSKSIDLYFFASTAKKLYKRFNI